MYQELFKKIGLTEEQAKVYENLLKTGVLPARIISTHTGIKRALVYKTLDQLIDLQLVEKREDIGKIALFSPSHPAKIREMLQKKEDEMKQLETSLNGIMGKLSSDWNILSGKPNVQFFEGHDGIKKVLDDSLTSEEIIDAYSDIESIEKYIPDINKEYVAKRRKFNIKKRGLILDTPKARELLKDYNRDITENRFVKCGITPPQTQTILQIYDNKVSYITLNDKMFIGAIIENPHIYSLQKYLYECLWENTKNENPKKLLPPETNSDDDNQIEIPA